MEHPESPKGAETAAHVLNRRGQHEAAVQAAVHAWAETDPAQPRRWWSLVDVLQDAGRHGESMQWLGRAQQQGFGDYPDWYFLVALGWVAMGEGERGRAAVRDGLRRWPEHAALQSLQAWLDDGPR